MSLPASSLVQYVVVRSDLMKSMGWPIGAVIAQTCHACTAVIHRFYNDQHTQDYLKDLDSMHKVVLDACDVSTLESLEEILKKNNIDHKLWIEQPENIPTCIALKPYPKKEIQKYVRHLKLYSL